MPVLLLDSISAPSKNPISEQQNMRSQTLKLLAVVAPMQRLAVRYLIGFANLSCLTAVLQTLDPHQQEHELVSGRRQRDT